jgi:hypothetical protein
MTRRLAMLAGLLVAAAAASAQDDYSHGRVLSVEPGVTVQRASEPGAEEAFPNLPFLPGDRVWTDQSGRSEFQFADGTVLRLDAASKLDYVAHDDGAGDRVVLRLWSGALYLHNRAGRGHPDLGIETPGGVVEARVRGVYRVDAVGGETRLSVYEGEAALLADREVAVRAGERVHARPGEPVEEPQGFDRAARDEFDQWDADRGDRQAYASTRRTYLPENVLPYAGELDAYGAWYYQSEIGHIWRPYVAAGWRPYYDGRWAWTPFGWTWVAAEPWGWAPFHYGRWGYTPMLGWYWIPGNAWGPAWVSWAWGGDYVGWCPLGHRDRPVLYDGRRAEIGRAVPRGGAAAASGESWVYVSRADFHAADVTQKVQHTLPAGHEVHAVEHAQVRPGRDLAPVHAGTGTVAVPRSARTRPAPGHAAPELRAEPSAAVRFPTARRGHRVPEEESRPAASRPAQPMRVVPDAQPQPPAVHTRPNDADHEVLRRVFGPLSQPRPAEAPAPPTAHKPAAGARERAARPRATESARPAPATPRTEAGGTTATRGERQQSPAPSSGAHGTSRPQKDKDH